MDDNRIEGDKRNIFFRIELVWWVITALVVGLILLPILWKIPAYPFLWPNVAFIVVLVTFTRYIFQLRFAFLSNWRYIKVGLIFACIIIAFLLGQEINLFQSFLDDNGIEALVGNLPKEEQLPMIRYIRSEMLLFGTGAVIACGVLPIRLVVSIWRKWNGYEEL